MKYYIFSLLLVLSLSSRAQKTATQPAAPKVLKEDPGVYYRMQRVWYQRHLGIDSAAAMKLVKADESEREGVKATFENASLGVAARAAALKSLKSTRTSIFKQVLNTEQLSRLSGNSPSSQRSLSNALPSKSGVTAKSERLFALHQAYGKALKSIREDAKLDSVLKQQKIKELREKRDKQVNAFLAEQAQQAELGRKSQVSLKEIPAAKKEKKAGKEGSSIKTKNSL